MEFNPQDIVNNIPFSNTPPKLEAQNSPDYADKVPFFDEKRKKLLKTSLIGCGAISGLLIIAGLIYMLLPRNPGIANPGQNTQTPTPTPTTSQEKSLFAYIKDKHQVWLADYEGANKDLVVEVVPSSEQHFSALDWKAKNNLSYSQCGEDRTSSSKKGCIINTIDIETKSTSKEIETPNLIRKFSWSPNQKYLAYIEESEEEIFFKLKTGTVTTMLFSTLKTADPANTGSRVFFTANNENIVYSGVSKVLIPKNNNSREFDEKITPVVQIYLLNGTKIDEIENAFDPFIIDEMRIGYKKDESLIYRELGEEEETTITPFAGYNAQIAPGKNLIAYWYYENNLNNVILGVFDSTLNIHRNILRGIVLPIWLSNDKILGIKADNCLGGGACQLYEFQTNSISIVDVSRGNVIQVDQGKNITEVSIL